VPCHTPFDRDLPRWIESRAQKNGKRIPREAVAILIERAGRDLSALASALESLSVYSSSRTEISAQEVESLLGKSAEEDVFRFVIFCWSPN